MNREQTSKYSSDCCWIWHVLELRLTAWVSDDTIAQYDRKEHRAAMRVAELYSSAFDSSTACAWLSSATCRTKVKGGAAE
jgi:hypothetical protein